MKFSCNNCKLKSDIEKYQIELNNLIEEKNHMLSDKNIIYLSEFLDVLVYKCVSCNKSVKQLIENNNVYGVNGLKDILNEACLESTVKGFNGIRWIGQPTYAIKSTSQIEFLNFEINLN